MPMSVTAKGKPEINSRKLRTRRERRERCDREEADRYDERTNGTRLRRPNELASGQPRRRFRSYQFYGYRLWFVLHMNMSWMRLDRETRWPSPRGEAVPEACLGD